MKFFLTQRNALLIKWCCELFHLISFYHVIQTRLPRRSTQVTFFICFYFLLIQSATAYASDTYQKQLTYVVTNIYLHDPLAFTQGLAWDSGIAYEGTGLYGASSLRQVDYKTGEVKRRIDYPDDIFAESITVFQDKIYQLTWKNQKVFVYNRDDFKLLKIFEYFREGWGITSDGQYLIVSDGSATLLFLDSETLVEINRITIYDSNGPVENLNDLEYINGKVFANVLGSDRVAVINPDSEEVESWLDLSGLRKLLDFKDEDHVLNGIMYDPVGDRLFVTGKGWPKLFEIRLTSVE